MAKKPIDRVTLSVVAILIIGALTVTSFLIFDYRYQTGVFSKLPAGGAEIKK